MKILAIESSCDETGAAVLENKNGEIKVLSNILATSSDMHAITGGIIPENAAREQVKAIIPVIIEALIAARRGDAGGRAPDNAHVSEANEHWREGQPEAGPQAQQGKRQDPNSWQEANKILIDEIDTIAVTYGPGLIGSLLIGVETAKTLSFALNKPLIPVNHLLAHLYANFIVSDSKSYKLKAISFPFIGLIVSGGHTDLLYFKSHDDFKWLGGTRDDAAGEAIDKIGRMLDLNYPAGPEMEKRANEFMLKANSSKLKTIFQSPMIGSKDFDFSFSGLKAEVMRYINKNQLRGDAGGRVPDTRASEQGEGALAGRKPAAGPRNLNDNFINEVCYAVQKAIFDVLVKKTLAAAEKYNCKTILLGGGVSANQTLIEKMNQESRIKNQEVNIFSPKREYCTDNAAMIGAYALIAGKTKGWESVKSNPELYFG